MSNHLARAWKLYELRRDEIAIEEVQRHLAKNPTDTDALRLHAHAAARLGRCDEALTAAREAAAVEPDNAHVHFALAVAYRAAGERGAAEQSIKEALRLDPDEAGFHAFLANLLIQDKRSQEALPVIHAGLALEPCNRSLLFSRPLALWALERQSEARRLIDEGLKLVPNDSNLHALKGALLTHRGEGRDAIAHLLESLRIDPENSWAHKKLSEAKQTVGLRGVFRRVLRVGAVWGSIVICIVGFLIAREIIGNWLSTPARDKPTPEQLRFRELRDREHMTSVSPFAPNVRAAAPNR